MEQTHMRAKRLLHTWHWYGLSLVSADEMSCLRLWQTGRSLETYGISRAGQDGRVWGRSTLG
jgi:hypothetical protein